MRVIPGLDPVEDRECELVAGVPVALVEKFALSPVVAMGNGLTLRWPAPPGRHLQRVGDQLRADVVRYRPVDHPARPRVDDRSEVHLAPVGAVFGDVHDPQPVGPIRIERSLDEIRLWIGTVAAVAAMLGSSRRVVDPDRAAHPHQLFGLGLRTRPAHPQAQLVTHPR